MNEGKWISQAVEFTPPAKPISMGFFSLPNEREAIVLQAKGGLIVCFHEEGHLKFRAVYVVETLRLGEDINRWMGGEDTPFESSEESDE